MIAWLLARLARLGGALQYTDEMHEANLAAIAEDAERIVGTCSRCGDDLRLLLDALPRRVVCNCGAAIPEAFLDPHHARRAARLRAELARVEAIQHERKGTT